MRILGIDPGSLYAGYGIIDASAGGESFVACGVVRLSSKEEHAERIRQLFEAITALIREHTVTQMAVEMPVYARNPQSLLKLGRAQGAAILAAMQLGVPVEEYTPTEVKKAVSGKGTATKDHVARLVAAQVTLPKDVEIRHDAFDALAVALCHAHRRKQADRPVYSDWASFLKSHPDRFSAG